MTDHLQGLLNTIRTRAAAYGERLQSPCPAESLRQLEIRATKELGQSVPDGYAEFLRAVDGLDWNGLVVYASERASIPGYTDRFVEGYVEGNLEYRDFEPLREFLIFADDGVALYTYFIPQRDYRVITRVGLSELATYGSFDELIADALTAHL